jgi:5-methylcytosine-specific restriction endonuclease McrA
MRTCNVCQLEKDDSKFRSGIVKGRLYTRKDCTDCENIKKRKWYERAKTSTEYIQALRIKQKEQYEKSKSDERLLAKRRGYCNISNNRRKESEKYKLWLDKRREVNKVLLFERKLQKAIDAGPVAIISGDCVHCKSLTIVRHGEVVKCRRCKASKIVKCYNKTKYNCSNCGIEYLSTKRNKGICAVCRDKQQKKSDASRQARKAAKRARKRIVTQSINVNLIYKRDGYRCVECKSKVVKSKTYKPNQATIDHIIPIAKGGSHTIDNLQTMCQSCNSNKRDIVKDGTQIGIFCAVSN